MITLKYWNSLTNQCRRAVLDKLDIDDLNLAVEYHHNFNYDATGQKLKSVLTRLYVKDNRLVIEVRMLPTFAPTRDKTKAKDNAHTVNSKPSVHKYYFRKYSKDDPEDGETIWEEATSEQEARDMVRSEYWNITRLDLLRVE